MTETERALKEYLKNYLGPREDPRLEEQIKQAKPEEAYTALTKCASLTEPSERYLRVLNLVIGDDLEKRMYELGASLNHNKLPIPKDINPMNYMVMLEFIRIVSKSSPHLTKEQAVESIKELAEKMPNNKKKKELLDFYGKSYDIVHKLRYNCPSVFLRRAALKIPDLFENYDSLKKSFDEVHEYFFETSTPKLLANSFNALIREYDDLNI